MLIDLDESQHGLVEKKPLEILSTTNSKAD